VNAAPTIGRPPDRYGRSATPSRRGVAVLAGVLATPLLAWVVWYAVTAGNPAVQYSVADNGPLDDTHAHLTAEFTMSPGKRAICTVSAANTARTVVGWSDLVVGPSTERTFRTTLEVPTMERAAGATITACVPE
jgi:hypothetical protein